MRHLSPQIIESLSFFPAVLLLGARQSGKSTLAKELVKQKILSQYITLDDFTVLSAFTKDPDGALIPFINNQIALDEIQRVPDLMRALKKNIDEHREKGRFLLTGSANVLSHSEVTESLTGRMDVLILEGLSIPELYDQPKAPTFLKELLQIKTSPGLKHQEMGLCIQDFSKKLLDILTPDFFKNFSYKNILEAGPVENGRNLAR